MRLQQNLARLLTHQATLKPFCFPLWALHHQGYNIEFQTWDKILLQNWFHEKNCKLMKISWNWHEFISLTDLTLWRKIVYKISCLFTIWKSDDATLWWYVLAFSCQEAPNPIQGMEWRMCPLLTNPKQRKISQWTNPLMFKETLLWGGSAEELIAQEAFKVDEVDKLKEAENVVKSRMLIMVTGWFSRDLPTFLFWELLHRKKLDMKSVRRRRR